MYCKNCGKPINEGVRFCPNCGADQEAPVDNSSSQHSYTQQTGMSSRTTAILSYFFWIGFIIAICAGTRDEFSNFHLNQSLVLHLFGLIGAIPLIGWIWDMILFVIWIMALASACNGECKPMPILGGITIIK